MKLLSFNSLSYTFVIISVYLIIFLALRSKNTSIYSFAALSFIFNRKKKVKEMKDDTEIDEHSLDNDEHIDNKSISNDDQQDNDPNPYNKLGKRRKHVPFQNKVKQVNPDTKEWYKEIVDGLNKYKFNDRISIPGETFSYKKERLIFLMFVGKTLKIYFKIHPNELKDSTIPVKDVSNIVKYKDLPTCLVIKSGLAARRAISLGGKIAKSKQIPSR